ncbi:MFS transporter, partial [Corynebacterium bovis]
APPTPPASPTSPTAPPPPDATTPPRTLGPRVTTVLLLSALLPLLDSSLVNVLLPPIGASLGVGAASAQLGVSTYMLAATAGIILSTTSLRRWGSRRVWLASVVVFAVASVGVGLSPTLPVFVATRVIQGLACGFIMPAVQHLASQIVGRAGMRAALATVGLPAVIAPAFGPLLGGVLVGAVGWRALFLVNVPVAVVAVLLSRGALPDTPGRSTPLGLGQAVPAVLGMVGLLWAVSGVGSLPGPVVAVIAGAAVVCVGTYCVCDVRAATPLLGMGLYRNPAFATVMVLCLVVGAVFYGTLLSSSLHVQGDLGQPAWTAGLLLGVQGAGAWVARSLVKGPWREADAFVVIAAGLVVAAVGTVGIQAVTAWSAVTVVVAVVGALLRGLGLGACTLLALSAAYEVVTDDDAPAVGAHTRLMLQFGGALGAVGVGVWGGGALALGLGVAVVALCGAAAAGVLVLRRRSVVPS